MKQINDQMKMTEFLNIEIDWPIAINMILDFIEKKKKSPKNT